MHELRGLLKILILKELEKGEATGYELIKRLSRFKKPSPGSVYPLLKELLESGFLNVRREGRKKVYSLSEKGKRVLREAMEKEKEAIAKKIDVLKSSGILNEREAVNIIQFITTRREILIKLHELKNWDVFIDALTKAVERDKNAVEKVLEKIIKELKKI